MMPLTEDKLADLLHQPTEKHFAQHFADVCGRNTPFRAEVSSTRQRSQDIEKLLTWRPTSCTGSQQANRYPLSLSDTQ